MNKVLKKVATGCIIGASALTLLVGCSNTSDDSSKAAKADAPITYEKQDANNLIMNVKKVETVKTQKTKDKVIVTMTIKNNSPMTQDIGSIDFVLKTADKTYTVDPDSIAFGQPIKAGASLDGDVTFVVPDSVEKGTVQYKPAKESLAEWKIDIEE
ncbi:DUF4352 domain-containing protein [Listeria sp. FSL L7-1582]|uniref:DUF4352 domain-containing protein n=1 Tax=Listeria portnoyi TaxID=2713504 RepID=UPI00164E60C0|nr:DUF4352 domain-containing protein [Listeria portnoyi]MBC6309722.1 DUF4352 domain-containing protein [Listeria portnoyi]